MGNDTDKRTFVFDLKWHDILSDYAPQTRLQVYEAIMCYVATGGTPELEPLAKMAFAFIKGEVDKNSSQRSYYR